jgi:hypothetical protein
LASLRRKYTDASLVTALADQKIWIGMTADQLIDAWGEPDRIREYSSVSDLIYEYKYTKSHGNQFPARITVADGSVMAWTQSNKPRLLQRLGLAPAKPRRPLA